MEIEFSSQYGEPGYMVPYGYHVYNIGQDMFEYISSNDMEANGQVDTTAELLYKDGCQLNVIQMYNAYAHFYPPLKK